MLAENGASIDDGTKQGIVIRVFIARYSKQQINRLAAIVNKILGSGELAGARFVQRVNTSGGVGPTGACPTAGTERRVDYTADYIFYG